MLLRLLVVLALFGLAAVLQAQTPPVEYETFVSQGKLVSCATALAAKSRILICIHSTGIQQAPAKKYSTSPQKTQRSERAYPVTYNSANPVPS